MLALACAALAVLHQPVPAVSAPAPIRAWLITRPLPTDTGAARVTRDYLGGETTAFPDSDATGRRNVVIQSAPIAQALEHYFLHEVWEKIPSERRENEAVAALLESSLQQAELH